MRIAILGTRGIPSRYGGFETFTEQLAIRLVERGHEVTVFCEAETNATDQYRGVRLRHIPRSKVGPLSTVLFDGVCLWKARSSFDVVYMLGYGASGLCWLPRLWGTQVWINMDGLEWARKKWGPIARCYFRIAESIAMWTPSRIVADAAEIKGVLRSRHSWMPPCDVIPYGCEIVETANRDELSSYGLLPDSYYLVVCRFEPENHLKEIIEGFLEANTRARLVLVGDSRRDTYGRSLTKYKDDRVVFVGPVYDVPRIQALRYFCKGYLHGHSVGGTNPSLLEAMGCGNVILAHDNPFNREVLGTSAIFFSTPAQIGAAIDSIDLKTVDLASLKSAVVKRARQFYGWEQITDHYCDLLALVSSESRDRSEVIQRGPVSSGGTMAPWLRGSSSRLDP
jgi:glycosyltransferase involved in cell wall biosynthesis